MLFVKLSVVICLVFAGTVASQDVDVAETRANQAVLKDFYGMTNSELATLKSVIENFLPQNPSNDVLANKVYQYLESTERNTRHLVAVHRCFDYCFSGQLPKKYAVYDIDRNSTRLMITSRSAC